MLQRKSEEGIALLLVLWIIVVLMVIVLSLSFTTRTETQASLAFKEGLEKRFLAEAGLERAIMELQYRKQNRNAVAEEGKEVWRVDGTPQEGTLGDGAYSVRIVDESGKININQLNDANAIIVRQLLLNRGLSEEVADTIVDSIMDWKDPDDLHRLRGAESDYYMSLQNPYKAKNSSLDTLEELLLVKGITPEILYGSAENRGLVDLMTVSATSTLINVNAAPREVLMAVPGMTAEIVERIISLRQERDIEPADVGLPNTGNLLGGASGGGTVFTVESTGYREDRKKGFTVKATFSFDASSNAPKYLYYKSPSKRPL
jgi:general secretion pathway protein K